MCLVPVCYLYLFFLQVFGGGTLKGGQKRFTMARDQIRGIDVALLMHMKPVNIYRTGQGTCVESIFDDDNSNISIVSVCGM